MQLFYLLLHWFDPVAAMGVIDCVHVWLHGACREES
jgi:hypothetical protein